MHASRIDGTGLYQRTSHRTRAVDRAESLHRSSRARIWQGQEQRKLNAAPLGLMPSCTDRFVELASTAFGRFVDDVWKSIKLKSARGVNRPGLV
jgi:hypothetical protein